MINIDISRQLLEEDLEHILLTTQPLWADVKDKVFFVTGGTGFFGKWLLHSFDHINTKLNLNNKLIVLTRNSDLFLQKNLQFQGLKGIEYLNGDVKNFEFPEGDIDYIIHAATEASEALNQAQPMLMYDTIVEGTRRVLDLGKEKRVKAIVHTTSGAIYGKQPSDITHIPEDNTSCPNVFAVNAAYGEGKRVGEMMASMYNRHYGVPSKIARCFALLGPYLPLDIHYAAGNFISNILNNEDVIISGDGTPYRSYLYASDLAVWLWTILFIGKVDEAYNVGSDEDLTIEQLARMIAAHNPVSTVKVLNPNLGNVNPSRYVPSIEKAKNDLKLSVHVRLHEAITKTINFNRHAYLN